MIKRNLAILSSASIGVVHVLLSSSSLAAPAQLDIDLAHPNHAISPAFYGLMTEEINHSYDGGLFAELIQNRTFQDPGAGQDGAPIHWSLVGSGKVSTTTADPVNFALPVSLRLELAGATGGVANDGYWGIPVRPDTKYTASFFARGADGFSGPVTASLLTDAGEVTVATAESESLTGEWKKYEVSFKTPKDAPTTAKARLVLSATGKGTVYFSFVSLFPPTYQAVPGGLRPDLMSLMAAMNPKFIRLPGGNYVEGGRFPDRFNWKKMVGPAELRPGHMGCWGYRSSDGFGLPEYLLWCRQLGAEPVLALFAGYTLNGDYMDAGSPEMAIYTEEALQEIEYLIGAGDTEWGRRRVADGFGEPFPLHYVEIGNEDFFDKSGSYDGRFTQMAMAIRAKYPQIKIIATAPVKSFKPDLYDDHLYAGARQVLDQFGQYDSSSQVVGERNTGGLKTFVGEWATQGGRPTPNMMSALADAVYVMGLERNSDNVVMQCYAPLLTNVNPEDRAKGYPHGWQWDTCLIGFDALNSFGSPSYHVLATFGQNRGDEVLPATLKVPTAVKPVEAAPHGCTGVGNYETRVEYKNFSVTGQDGRTLSADLVNDTNQWHFPNEGWTFNDVIIQSRRESPGWALAGDPHWENYTIHLQAQKLGGREGFIVLWHAHDGENFRWWNIGGWGNTVSRCEVSADGRRQAYGPSSPFVVETGRWYDLRLEVSGHNARGYVDNKLVMDTKDEEPPSPVSAYATASYAKDSRDVIVKFVNIGAEPLETAINLQGASGIGSTGKAIVIAGDPNAVNSIDSPRNIAPQEEPLANVAASFTRTFAAHSVSLLRFPANR
jgi:alpha-L-arabinofuranosidase